MGPQPGARAGCRGADPVREEGGELGMVTASGRRRSEGDPGAVNRAPARLGCALLGGEEGEMRGWGCAAAHRRRQNGPLCHIRFWKGTKCISYVRQDQVPHI
jgi:hypothetical protein